MSMSESSHPDDFDLQGAAASNEDFATKAWYYLKRFNERANAAVRDSRRELTESLGARVKVSETLAAHLGLMAFELARAATRQRRKGQSTEELDYLQRWLTGRMRAQGVEIEDPVGHPFTEGLYDLCEVLQTEQKPGVQAHLVGETIEPIVRYQGKVVHLARVVGWKPQGE
jgi:hypothetical protein